MIIGLWSHTDRWMIDKGTLVDPGDAFYLLHPLQVLLISGLIIWWSCRSCDHRVKARMLIIACSGLLILTILELIFKTILHQPAGSLPTDAYGVHLSFSYPSGHAARLGFMISLGMILLPRCLIPPTVIIGIIFMLLLFLSAIHYPSDLIGGALLGMIIGTVTAETVQTLGQNKPAAPVEE